MSDTELMSDAPLARIRARIRPLFVLTVLVPTLLAVLYYGIFASDVYISESRFVVRAPEKPASSEIGVLLRSTGFSESGDEVNAAQSAVISRDALQSVNGGDAFARAYSQPGISLFDRFDPLGSGGSFEGLYSYFRRMVTLDREAGTAISVLKVRAFTPQDSQHFNEKLLEMAEATVNRLNDRGQRDMIQFAERDLAEAKAADEQAARALAAYRNRSGVEDPDKQAGIQLQMISKLQDELIATQNQIASMAVVAPLNPQLPMLRARAGELQTEIGNQNARVAGSDRSLAATQADYQQLMLDSQIADKQLTSALAGLDSARDEALRKQAYVERIVEPNLPDAPVEPRRLRGILSVLAVGLIAYGVLSMLLAGMREHKD